MLRPPLSFLALLIQSLFYYAKQRSTSQILLSVMNFNMETRRLLECECVRLAVKNDANDEITAMAESLFFMEHPDSEGGFVAGNFGFHHALAIASENAV